MIPLLFFYSKYQACYALLTLTLVMLMREETVAQTQTADSQLRLQCLHFVRGKVNETKLSFLDLKNIFPSRNEKEFLQIMKAKSLFESSKRTKINVLTCTMTFLWK